MIKPLISAFSILLSTSSIAANFATDGNGIHNIISATVGGKAALYVSELDGSVSAYKTNGTELWRNATQSANGTSAPALLFEMEAADIDGDGSDDLIGASADGHVYHWNSNGRLRWKWRPDGAKVRFSDVAVVQVKGKAHIFAGGNNSTLYEVNSNGTLLSETPIPGNGTVRKIATGQFLQAEQDTLLVWTYGHDKYGWAFLGLFDPKTKTVLKDLGADAKLGNIAGLSGLMLTDFSVSDFNGDGLDDMLLFGAGKSTADFLAIDSRANLLGRFTVAGKHKQRYAHANGVHLPANDEVLMQYGSLLFLLDAADLRDLTSNEDGIKQEMGTRYSGLIYQSLASVPAEKSIYAAGPVGGGNDLFHYDLEQANWLETSHSQQGRMKEVEANLAQLYQQSLAFERPVYQAKPSKPWRMISSKLPAPEVAALEGAELITIPQRTFYENTDRTELIAAIGANAPLEKRGDYKYSREDIIAYAAENEANGTPFALWAGHGNDPFYVQLETLKEILRVAPNTCYGFIYAEMHNPADLRYQYFAEHYVPELAKAIRNTPTKKAKLYFRYKNIFWGASSHVYPWKEMFYSGKYSDILVPASEDTTSRTQEINLTGRVGMFASGLVDDYAMRLVDDNPTSWRPLSPGGQRSVSPYLRQGVMMAAYGARMGILIDNNYLKDENQPSLNVLYALMKSGALPLVEKEDILSISAWHLTDDVDEHLVDTIENHHNIKQYSEDDDNAVLAMAQIHWAGTDLPEHDYSRQALGVKYRWLNYIPELPHGMVPMVPSEHAPAINIQSDLNRQGTPFFISDAKHGLVNKQKISAKQFGPTIAATVQAGAQKMPVIVSGAAWSAVRIDDRHIRVILMDQGYIDPQERRAKIALQTVQAQSVTDILTKQKLIASNGAYDVTIPAGSLRLIDIELTQPYLGGSDNDKDGRLFEYDNCPYNANADQLDSDGDGIGDTCQPVEPPTMSIQVDKTDLSIDEGQSTQVTVTVTNAEQPQIAWHEQGTVSQLAVANENTATVTITAQQVSETTSTTLVVTVTSGTVVDSQSIKVTVNDLKDVNNTPDIEEPDNTPSTDDGGGGSLGWYILIVIMLIILSRVKAKAKRVKR